MSGECVRVVVRIRPLSEKEVADGRKETVRANSERAEVSVLSTTSEKEAAKTFTFDASFGSESTQEQLYGSAAYPIVESVLKGFNGTILAVSTVAGWRAPPYGPCRASTACWHWLAFPPLPSSAPALPSMAKLALASPTPWRA
jgi:hypothetical protein